jgi:hypothetical protein
MKVLMRLTLTLACTALVIIIGSIDSGNLHKEAAHHLSKLVQRCNGTNYCRAGLFGRKCDLFMQISPLGG